MANFERYMRRELAPYVRELAHAQANNYGHFKIMVLDLRCMLKTKELVADWIMRKPK